MVFCRSATATTAKVFVGGGQVGYNYQFTPGSGLVVGLEADAQYTDFSNRSRLFPGSAVSFTGTPGVAGGSAVRTPGSEMNFFGTVRGRVGYAFDRVLFYGTGGFAYGDGGAGGDDFRTGYTAGGGYRVRSPHRLVPELLPLFGRDAEGRRPLRETSSRMAAAPAPSTTLPRTCSRSAPRLVRPSSLSSAPV